MRKTISALATMALPALFHVASAQSLIESQMLAQTQMHLNDTGKTSSCGMRVTGFHDAGNKRYVFDTSITIREEGYGFGKLAGMVGPAIDDPSQLKSVEVYSGWFRKQGGEPTIPLNSYMSGEDPKTKLFVADSKPTLDFLNAIVMGLPIQISISWRKGNSVIYYGTAHLENSQRDQFLKCLVDLAKVLEGHK